MNEFDAYLLDPDFLLFQIPADKSYYLKYFSTNKTNEFICYYLKFNKMLDVVGRLRFINMFREHTGNLACSINTVQDWFKQAKKLETMDLASLEDKDFDFLFNLKSGKTTREKIGLLKPQEIFESSRK